MSSDRTRFGIIRYAGEHCVFDGWYDKRELAEPVYADWCRNYRGWIVVLVTAELADMHYQAHPKLVERNVRTGCLTPK
jgi:hypothetical protein